MKYLLIVALCLLAIPADAQSKRTRPAPTRLAAAALVTQTQTVTITVTGPFPTAVACNPSAPSISNSAPIGTVVCTLSATMSDGTAFIGTFGITGAATPGMFKIGTDGKSIVTARALTATDVTGSPYTLTMSATQ